MLRNEMGSEQGALPIPESGRKRQVLVIDDNKPVRESVSRTLVSLGHQVTLSSNGFDGGLLFCTRDYDLVIIDLHMPQTKIWQLTGILKTHSPKTPVILVAEPHEEKSSTNHVEAIIPKPLKLDDIEGTVRRLLSNGK